MMGPTGFRPGQIKVERGKGRSWVTHLSGHNAKGARAALVGLTSAAVLAGCSVDGISPDQAEVNNMWEVYKVPKSAPAAFVGTFDRFCTNGVSSRSDLDRSLRAAHYVPLQAKPRQGVRVYVVDDRRPAVAVSDTMCLVQAKSRTGQTDLVRRYVADVFPDARPTDASQLGRDVEQAWVLPDNRIVATQRTDTTGVWSRYALILFHPDTPLIH